MKNEVLIIDDDQIVLLLHRLKVVKSGIHPTPECFETAKDALNYMKSTMQDKINFLLLLDINMYDMDGWEMMEEISKMNLQGEIFVILVTSSIDYKDKNKALNYPLVIDYIEKPLTDTDIAKIKENGQLKEFLKLVS